jgi:hypothetical protein
MFRKYFSRGNHSIEYRATRVASDVKDSMRSQLVGAFLFLIVKWLCFKFHYFNISILSPCLFGHQEGKFGAILRTVLGAYH